MFRNTVLSAALAAAFGSTALFPAAAFAADDKELAQIRDEIRQMKSAYEARIQALEARLQAAEKQAAAAPTAAPVAVAEAYVPPAAAAPQPAAGGSNNFNPAVSLILGGTYSNLTQDPARYRLQGFIPGGEVGPGARSFNLGESELTLAANIDPTFSGRLTFSLTPDNSVSVEESFFETNGLSNGLNFKAGRFLSSLGYLNSQHAHAWDFVDAPLVYQAFYGGQFKNDGIQARWLAPADMFIELGAELGNGGVFPGGGRNKNGFGAGTVFAHVGDDIGESASWRAGLSYQRTGAHDRAYEDFNNISEAVTNSFSGHSQTWALDGIYKWAPGGNGTSTNFKLQGEYFHRKDDGTLASSLGGSGLYNSLQSGWYLQGVYQFMPSWRFGVRHDALSSGAPRIGLVASGALPASDFGQLAQFSPRRNTVMLDYSPSEFARLRLQYARDESRPGTPDNQIFLQYIMSLGAHGAHSF